MPQVASWKKTAVIAIISMWSLVLHQTAEPQ